MAPAVVANRVVAAAAHSAQSTHRRGTAALPSPIKPTSRRPSVSVNRRSSSISCKASAKKQVKAAQVVEKVKQDVVVTSDWRDEVLPTFCRPGVDDEEAMRGRFEKAIREAQDSICAAIEEVDGTKFRQDAWTRDGFGGGITRVMQGGNVWEKAGVNVSVVYGSMAPDAYYTAIGKQPEGPIPEDAGRVPFFAAGISSVMHPLNPKAPTMHFNYRYFETEPWNGIDSQWWFGGGTDITPSYLFEEDMKHFHGTLKEACDKHDPEYYPKFKEWCDDYFVIKHRGETRGLGGIFFDDLNDRDKEEIFEFSKQLQGAVVPAYVPIVTKRKDEEFTQKEKEWQQIRRGRYAEFNLVYDRGTIFGLKTGGRIESILMSLPLTARWEYDFQVEEGSPEADILDAFKNPRDWLSINEE